MKLLCSLLLVLVCSLSLAQQNDFPNNEKNRWVHKEINLLKKEDLIPNWSVATTKTQQSQRKKFASITHAVSYYLRFSVMELEKKLSGEKKPKPAELKKAKGWKSHVAELTKMVELFSADLKSLKLDPKKIKEDLADTRKRIDKLPSA